MDPPTLINHGSYNLAEIWPFGLSSGGSVGESNGGVGGGNGGVGLELRTGSQFGQIWGQFADSVSGNKDESVEHHPNMVMDQRVKNGGGVRKRREAATSEDESTKVASTSGVNGNGMDENDGKRTKTSGSQNENHDAKADVETSSVKLAEQKAQPSSEPPKQDYIHVRARRGQATDSHSLAERARREKISERMKILQDLVPGCNKVIGKALVLDEIINYIQSLQRQVEFLSMKLEAVNSRNPGIEGFPSKDFGQQTFETAGMPFGSQAATEYVRGSSPEWLHMQVGGGFERTT